MLGSSRRSVRVRVFAALVTAVVSGMGVGASAQDFSSPVTLQWFESSWKTLERRTPDLFAAGYGAVWTPPPGRALNTLAGGGIGYDIYDRFDLGKPNDPTLYGTETGYRTLVRSVQRMGGNVYVDFVHHHVGSFDLSPGNSPGPYVQDRYDYPGFKLSLPGQQDGDTYRDPPPAPGGNPAFEYQYRLARLITLNFTSTNSTQFVRDPVPGAANNIPQAASAWAIPTASIGANNTVVSSTLPRRANTPSEANRRLYPDLQGTPRTVIDNGVSYTVYDYNLANPSAGDPVPETVSGDLMRYAQWMVQYIGVDGLRIDAARHVPLGAFDATHNPTSVDVRALIDRAVAGASTRFNLDGTRRSVFQFQEVFNGDVNFLQGFVRKSAPPGDTTAPNRDVLDFPLWFAMRNDLKSSASNSDLSQNNWYNIRNASQDNRDDGLAHNGSQSIGFVNNHDEGGVELSNVAHAWVLLRPGQAYVFFRGNEFDRTGNTQFFLKDGRGDSLGGLYGNLVTSLVDIRNTHGRGNFAERWIDSNGQSRLYAFERRGSMVVGLNSFTNGQGITSFDQRTMYVAFDPGQRLIELTGNAADPAVDPLAQIPELVVVDPTDNAGLGSGRVTLRIPRNQNVNGVSHGRGYVAYGLPRPTGTLALTEAGVPIPQLAGETPTPATNATARLSAIGVVKSDNLTVTLNTNRITLSDGFVDHRAAGSMALIKLDDGVDLNASGLVDNRSTGTANAPYYGFENFTSSSPGYVNATTSNPGTYSISFSTTGLAEGYHYLTARAFRLTGVNESIIYSDFRQTLYVDRLKPVSAVDSFASTGGNGSQRSLAVRSTDLTADRVHVLMNLPAALTDAQILALVGPGNQSAQPDRDLFTAAISSVIAGNHVATVITYEITGTYNIQRIPSLSITDAPGLGIGDLNGDGAYSVADVLLLEQAFRSGNTIFNPAADSTGDGRMSREDVMGVGYWYRTIGVDAATAAEYQRVFDIGFTIPEPASLGVVIGALPMLLRRRQHPRR